MLISYRVRIELSLLHETNHAGGSLLSLEFFVPLNVLQSIIRA